MKKLIWAVSCVFFAVNGWAANNIKMVSYFPIPYASYSDLKVDGTCDVGLLGQCGIKAEKGLAVSSMTVTSGGLELNAASGADPRLATEFFHVGDIGAGGETWLNVEQDFELKSGATFFHDHKIKAIKSTNADLYKLQLRGRNDAYLDFPVCGAMDINWANLTIDGKNGVYLVCGSGVKVEVSCSDDPNQEKCCESDETWNGTYCMQTCKAYEPETFYYMYYNKWYSAGSSLSAGEDMGGTCGGNYTVPDSYPSGTGVTHFGACREMGDACDGYGSCGAYNIGPETVWALQCENQADEQGYTLDNGEAANFGCAFKLEYGSTTSSSYCWTGYLVCKYNTWQCRADQTCGSTKGVCN